MWDMEAVRAILLSDNAPAQYTCQIWFTSDPDQLGSTGQKRAEWFLHTSLLAYWPGPFGQNLTQSARTKLDPGWFCIILSRTSLEEWNQVWKSETGSGLAAFCHNRAQWFLHNGLFPDKTCLAKPWPGHPDQIWVSFAQYDPCLLWKNGAENSEMDAGSRILHIYIYTIPVRFWLHAGRNGHNWP